MKLSWRYVFDGENKLRGHIDFACRDTEAAGYKYFAWGGLGI